MTNTPTLAQAVQRRRGELGLPLDLRPHGGPGASTVRRVERADADAARFPDLDPGRPHAKTLARLDVALGWPTGTALAYTTTGPIPTSQRAAERVEILLGNGPVTYPVDHVESFETEIGRGLRLYAGGNVVGEIAPGTWISYYLHYPTES